MKLTVADRRKLTNRLPLLESMYKDVGKREKKELLKKIENARAALGMPRFLEEVEKGQKEEKVKKIKIKREKAASKYANKYLEGRFLKEQEKEKLGKQICVWKNRYGWTDAKMAAELERSEELFHKFKKRHLKTHYKLVNYKKIYPQKYIELKGEGLTDDEICKMFGHDIKTLKRFKARNFKIRYELNENHDLDGIYKVVIKRFINDLNDGLTFNETCKKYKLHHAYMGIVMKKWVIEHFEIKETDKLDPFKLCQHKIDGLKNTEIAEMYKVEPKWVSIMKTRYIKETYEYISQKFLN